MNFLFFSKNPENVHVSVLDAYRNGNGFMTLFDGERGKKTHTNSQKFFNIFYDRKILNLILFYWLIFPDFVKRKMLELVAQLVQSNDEISILITGLTVDWIEPKLVEMGIYGIYAPFGKYLANISEIFKIIIFTSKCFVYFFV